MTTGKEAQRAMRRQAGPAGRGAGGSLGLVDKTMQWKLGEEPRLLPGQIVQQRGNGQFREKKNMQEKKFPPPTLLGNTKVSILMTI